MKKFIVGILATLMLCGCVVGTTLAWLTDETAPIQNTFTAGDIEITLVENLQEGTQADYKMVPGKPLSKDYVVTVEGGSEKCYLFLLVLEGSNFPSYLEYSINDNDTEDGSDWLEYSNGGQTGNVYYRVVDAADAPKSFKVFEDNCIRVSTTATSADLEAAEGNNPTLSVTAFAIQYDYITDVDMAWSAILSEFLTQQSATE